jgi:hypothetical protein
LGDNLYKVTVFFDDRVVSTAMRTFQFLLAAKNEDDATGVINRMYAQGASQLEGATHFILDKVYRIGD